GAEDDAHWARLQQANALFKLSDLEASVLLYDEVAQSTSPWAEQAGVNAEETRLEQRIRGLPVTPRQPQG
ncbi:MAG: hypothetical protein GY851_34305, partial [bacterium]|nr:hypothetical protein [bacterium]